MTNPIIEYWPNGNKKVEYYEVNDELHRDPLEGPARILYYENGQVDSKEYLENNKIHRYPTLGPAIIHYNVNGDISFKSYWFNDKLHNPYGPAIIIDYRYYSKWYFNDINYTKEVIEYLNENNLNYKKMTKIDFNIMWMNIL